MITIRLSRVGKTKKPIYKVVVQDKQRDPWGKTNEFIGHYDPHTKKFEIKKERLEYWLKQGAELSATLNNILVHQKLISGKIRKASRTKKKSAAPAAAAPKAAPATEEKK